MTPTIGETVRARLFYRLVALVIFGGLWQLFAAGAGGLLIPSFTETMVAVVELLFDAELWSALVVSNQALVLGFGISLVLGIPIGLVIGRFPTLERFSDAYLNILLVTPMAAVIPLLLMSVGIGLASRVILVVLFAMVMVIVNTRAGIRQVDPSLIEMARCFGASERQLWRRVLLPGSLPAVMAGVRIGLGRAITGMVVVELLMVSVALGGLILNFRAFFEVEKLYALIIIIVIEALILISIARWVERKVTPWSQRSPLAA